MVLAGMGDKTQLPAMAMRFNAKVVMGGVLAARYGARYGKISIIRPQSRIPAPRDVRASLTYGAAVTG